MDSRPAMAIFELLDYIVNEVCALDLQVLRSGNCLAHPGCFLGKGMSQAAPLQLPVRKQKAIQHLHHACDPSYSVAQAGSLTGRSVLAGLG